MYQAKRNLSGFAELHNEQGLVARMHQYDKSTEDDFAIALDLAAQLNRLHEEPS
jgi:hypothetical protein